MLLNTMTLIIEARTQSVIRRNYLMIDTCLTKIFDLEYEENM